MIIRLVDLACVARQHDLMMEMKWIAMLRSYLKQLGYTVNSTRLSMLLIKLLNLCSGLDGKSKLRFSIFFLYIKNDDNN